MGNLKFTVILAVLISVGVAAWPSVTQTSVVHGVTVAVTPGNVAADSGMWDFAVAFSSNGKRLDDEVMESFVLVGDGRSVKPLAWEGEKAGGAHRVGVLKFIAIQPRPKDLELRLVRPAEQKPRVFHFTFGDWSV